VRTPASTKAVRIVLALPEYLWSLRLHVTGVLHLVRSVSAQKKKLSESPGGNMSPDTEPCA